MGLMNKFKNLFTDEEIIEDEEEVVDPVEIKEVKKEDTSPKLPTFMREKIEKEEKKDDLPDLDIDKEVKMESILDDENVSEEKSKFKFPIDLEDEDFIETRSRQSLHKTREVELNNNEEPILEPNKFDVKRPKKEVKVADLYKDKKEEVVDVDDKKFRATPIISPIYGVLDKNYTSDDVEERRGNNLEGKRHSKSVDFDSVRKKAYGSLADDIRDNLMCDNCEYMKEAKDCRKRRSREEDAKIEEPTYLEDDITMDEAAENYFDYGVEYEKKTPKPVDIDLDDEVKIVNHTDEEEQPKNEIPPVKSSINLLSTLKKSMGEEDELPEKKADDLELTDDLFNLIDSMYDERDD